MSEQQPLLQDPEAGESSNSESLSYRERLASWLESASFHKIVIALIAIDAAIVLVDLGYTLLSPDCTPEGPDGPEWLEILSHVSLGITAFFLLEIPLALTAFGFEYYNPFGNTPHAIMHEFDAFIIITTFVLEVFLKGKERELASLLIVLRLWRLVKLVGGIAVGAGELGEDTAKELVELSTALEHTKRELSQAQDDNKKLRSRLTSLGQSVD
ncbi:hypothetical protein GYMLUDRAFT_59895 [Collybiopsis luxurians FD-317 M1]|uniref:Hydrogen voltage-gated channel 1 n=1 Tax=Collybiopsis luxurians FD-317 M1 TaxID=944289 RepID=A0A0D0CV11_9AGAR|nr:hypothetical protein GYMLUDRAFT_59895 [Collybiopsis luxurians FD-317 M1]